MEYFWILLAFFLGMFTALSPGFLVIVRGEKYGPLIVEYKDEVYKLVKLKDAPSDKLSGATYERK